ncbi:MAG: class I SAM-dependent RNA methyltransferase [Saprospiraceae bacterium]|nr:class I SAM-dependent RNA methyltransferase [Saprospiraceae bacterium]
MKLIIRTLQGLEGVLAAEAEALGCTEIKTLTRAISCEGNQQLLYRCNYELRTAIKVMVPLVELVIQNEYQLYQAVKDIPWENYFSLGQTFAVEGVTHSDMFRHSQYVALKSKDAIADRFREMTGKRPFVNPVSPDISIVIHIRQNILTVLLDASGQSLHQRGYRVYPVEAPLNEVLAAGMLLLSGWDRSQPLLDPMCGSGTLLIEAAFLAANRPPQKADRTYCFMNWMNFDPILWKQVQDEAAVQTDYSRITQIQGYDKSIRCANAASTNISEAGLESYIAVERQDFFTSQGRRGVFLITNPPYDERLKEDDIVKFYKEIGDKLKKDFADSTAWIIGGNLEALKMVGLKPSKKIPLLNGDIESGFYKFDLYEGSKHPRI